MMQHGAYTLLLDACYDREQFPTMQDAIEWTWASSAEEIAAIEFVLSRFFTLEDGVYVQKRIQEEIEAFKEKSKKNKEIALEREAARREKKARNEHEPARNVHESPPNHKPLTNNQESNTARKRASACTLKSWMEEIKQTGEKMIPAEDTIWQDGIPKPFLHLAWKVFAEDMNTKAKKAKDWRAQFRTYVRKDYLKLWAMNREGQHYLTTAGKQAAIRFDMKELMDE